MTTVMVVDDSRFICDDICHFLEGSAFDVVATCKDAEEAIRSYSELLPDVVLMDVILPGIDGLEATEALLGRWKEARVVIVSSLAYDDIQQTAKDKGASGILFKPFTPEQLLEVLAPFAKEE